MCDLESGENIECAFDAIGCPIINYDDHDNDNDTDENLELLCLSEWTIEGTKTFVVFLDITNVVLDILLVYNLIYSGENGYAALLGFMTTVSVFVSIWMKWVMYGLKKGLSMNHSGGILLWLLATEFFIFVVEDFTTIFILTQVYDDDLSSYSETLTGRLNLWTSIMSGICTGLVLILFIYTQVRESFFSYQNLLWLPIVAFFMFDIGYMLYFAVDKVLLTNLISIDDRSGLILTYIVNVLISSAIILISYQLAIIAFIYGSGGN